MSPAVWTARLVVLGLMIRAAVPLAAQDAPDFTGRWVLVLPSDSGPEVPRAIGVRYTIARTNVRGEPMTPYVREVTIERGFPDGTRSRTYRVGIIGGTVPGIPSRGPHHHHQTLWEGRALVMEEGSSSGPHPRSGDWTERREVWTLDADGRLNVTIMTNASGAKSERVTLVYRRG